MNWQEALAKVQNLKYEVDGIDNMPDDTFENKLMEILVLLDCLMRIAGDKVIEETA